MRRLPAFALTVIVALALAVPTAAAGSTAVTVKLPTEADGAAYAPGEQGILFGQKGVETRLPGPVTDAETVTVGLGLDGTPNRVDVEQHLTLSGLGDFQFRVPGPARDIQALPGSQDQPGLRKGSALWQGFSPGTKQLAAVMHLFADQEAGRLPLRIHLSLTVTGRPLVPGRTASGPFVLIVTVENVSAIPVRVTTGSATAPTLAPVLDAVRRTLASHQRPAPGAGGIPTSVELTGSATAASVAVTVPFHVSGTVSFPAGTMTGLTSQGPVVPLPSGEVGVAFDASLGATPTNTLTIVLRGQAHHLGPPRLAIGADPSPPPAQELQPPAGPTWTKGLAMRPAAFDGTVMLATLMRTMWEVARLRQYDGYLGNPDVTGASRSTYRFVLSPLAPPAPGAAAPLRGVSRLGTALFGLLALAALSGLAMAWARA
jgi:hypothetical protein